MIISKLVRISEKNEIDVEKPGEINNAEVTLWMLLVRSTEG